MYRLQKTGFWVTTLCATGPGAASARHRIQRQHVTPKETITRQHMDPRKHLCAVLCAAFILSVILARDVAAQQDGQPQESAVTNLHTLGGPTAAMSEVELRAVLRWFDPLVFWLRSLRT
jgi:hypothetical protein